MEVKIKERINFYTGPIFRLEQVKIIDESGEERWRDVVVVNRQVAAIVPELSKDEVILVRQFRVPVESYVWEVPAGLAEKGEEPRECAERELIEETGYRTTCLTKLCEFHSSPGFSTETMHLYLARHLVEAEKKPDADEFLETRVFSRNEVQQMIKEGKGLGAKTLIGLMMWLDRKGDVQ